ncbi:MAG: DUF6671 family protein [Wenzhouxiangella sp.]
MMESAAATLESTVPAEYRGRRVALLTQHGKEAVLGPVLEPVLGCTIERVEGFDTDQLGTFTREIPRAGTQIEAARKKARIGMELAGLPLGLASEGAFGPDPMLGMLPWNVEVLVFIDAERELEVVGLAQGKSNHAHRLVSDWPAAVEFARQSGFPSHHLVIRPQSEGDPRLRKGIADWPELESAFGWAQAEADNAQVLIETDLRAHTNPTRQAMIRRAADDLLARLSSSCPACGAPGFWVLDRLTGLPCAACGAATCETRADILGCVKCDHRLTRPRVDCTEADPGRCDFCNP